MLTLMDTVYLKTTIPSYLAAHPSSLIVMAAHQQISHQWWKDRRQSFSLFSSAFVREEAERGDLDAAVRRLTFLEDIPELAVTPEVEHLAENLFAALKLPEKAVYDASHLAVFIVHKMDYLLTWNCKHIANAILQKVLFHYCQNHHLHLPIICTPEALME